jgi:hypothetical protein
MNLYLIERGPRPVHHKAPWHPVIICTARHTAEWEAGGSPDGATVWSVGDIRKDSKYLHEWSLNRWKGLDVTFICTEVYFDLPDGTNTRQFCKRAHGLISGAVWWSDKPLPKLLRDLGVIEAPDEFTRERIADDLGLCLLSESKAAKICQRRDIVC